jgi:hypothetical protein
MSDNYERWLKESLDVLIAGVPEEEVEEVLSTMRYLSAPVGQRIIDAYIVEHRIIRKKHGNN